MHALMAYIPEKKIGIVILTNTWGNKVPEVLAQRFFDLYLNQKPLKDWNKIYLESQTAAAANENTKPQSLQCQTIKTPDLKKYVGIYYNPFFGNLEISEQGDHLNLEIGPIGIIWQLSYCQNNLLKAFWPNPYDMNIPMLSSGQDLIEFTTGRDNVVQKMTIPYLNSMGNGVFERKGLRSPQPRREQ